MKKFISYFLPIGSILLLLSCYLLCLLDGVYSLSKVIGGQSSISHSSVYDCIFGSVSNIGSILAFSFMTLSLISLGVGFYCELKKLRKFSISFSLLSGLISLASGVLFLSVLNFISFVRVTPYIGIGSILVGIFCVVSGLLSITDFVLTFIKDRD